jgi:hypothetical protein
LSIEGWRQNKSQLQNPNTTKQIQIPKPKCANALLADLDFGFILVLRFGFGI